MMQLRQQQQMRLAQQHQLNQADQLRAQLGQADEAPPEVPERRSSIKRPPIPPVSPPTPPPLPARFGQVECLASRRQTSRPARSNVRPTPRPPPVAPLAPSLVRPSQPPPPPPPPMPALAKARRPAPKDIWSPSSSSLTSSSLAGSFSSALATAEQVVAPASSTTPPSSTANSTVVEQSQRPLSHGRLAIVELGEAGEQSPPPPPPPLAASFDGAQTPSEGTEGRSRSVSLQQRIELKQQQPIGLQGRSYSIAAPNERTKQQASRQQVAGDAAPFDVTSGNSLGRGVESRKRADHKYWTLPAALSGNAEQMGASKPDKSNLSSGEAAYGRAERGKADLASQRDESSDSETTGTQRPCEARQQTADPAGEICSPSSQQEDRHTDSSRKNPEHLLLNKQDDRDGQASTMRKHEQQTQVASLMEQPDQDRPSGSIKDDWLRRMYHQMHKSTPDRSLLEAANSQPDTGQITVKLKPPKTGKQEANYDLICDMNGISSLLTINSSQTTALVHPIILKRNWNSTGKRALYRLASGRVAFAIMFQANQASANTSATW